MLQHGHGVQVWIISARLQLRRQSTYPVVAWSCPAPPRPRHFCFCDQDRQWMRKAHRFFETRGTGPSRPAVSGQSYSPYLVGRIAHFGIPSRTMPWFVTAKAGPLHPSAGLHRPWSQLVELHYLLGLQTTVHGFGTLAIAVCWEDPSPQMSLLHVVAAPPSAVQDLARVCSGYLMPEHHPSCLGSLDGTGRCDPEWAFNLLQVHRLWNRHASMGDLAWA